MKKLRILFTNRPNVLTQPGGDTAVMVKVAEGLRALGVKADIDPEFKRSLKGYDLVHLHNFATPDTTRAQAQACVEAGVPYVVTTMYEDAPSFWAQMMAQAQGYYAYMQAGQPQADFEYFMQPLRDCQPTVMLDNSWTARYAAALIASGSAEQKTLQRDYHDARLVATYPLGCEIGETTVSGDLFTRHTGLKDFILCVGRVETRKNQLTLLKALEDSDLPLVIATGGFTYQPQYAQACQLFKRRGPTHFIQRMPDNILASAYAAARVHVLPSWYELPGIVSMEAARRGCAIVVSDRGTPRDYFGADAFYAEPDDPTAIGEAVQAAWDAAVPASPGLSRRIESCTWPNAAKTVLDIYGQALDGI
ncbi:MAG TPA: glycosyltransferase [Gammaproteobacteria bacterium]|nr:glycosyltransferase [Gammaproteobacteria bacterium]